MMLGWELAGRTDRRSIEYPKIQNDFENRATSLSMIIRTKHQTCPYKYLYTYGVHKFLPIV